jgi:tripeptidyl-peptidase II
MYGVLLITYVIVVKTFQFI